MRLIILAVGDDLPAWAQAAVEVYRERLRGAWRPSLLTIPAARRSPAMDADRCRRQEAEALRRQTPAGSLRIALDERGGPWTSADLARRLGLWAQAGRPVCLWLGGPDGLDPSLRAEADEVWSLSALTLPHALARVIVMEQIYRAWSILRGHPYHRA